MSVDREKLAEIVEAALLSEHHSAWSWAQPSGAGGVRLDGDFDTQVIADKILAQLAGFPPEHPFIIGRFRGEFFGATIDGEGQQRFTLTNGVIVTLTPPESNEIPR